MLLNDFCPKQQALSSGYFKFISDIKDTESVSIHFRRGDYVTNKSYLVLDLKYYYNAVELIRSKLKNPNFYIFSDDIDWVKRNFKNKLKSKITFQDCNLSNIEDLMLMSNCKHNIIANSTFSWWGAWLNKNLDKIVIAPSKFFKDDIYNTNLKSTYYPQNWIII